MTRDKLKNIEIPGEVVDTADPYKKGRVKVKVTSVYDKLDNDAIPWASPLKDTNGKIFKVPDVGQIVNVRFEDGDHYRPHYTCAEHYNASLQVKLEELSDGEYEKFAALYFDDLVQIYKDDAKLVLDYGFNQLIMDESSINLALKDNFGKITLGSESADQQAVLGNNYFDWMDDLIQILMNPYLGNMGAPVVPDPNLIKVLNEYQLLRNTKFLSDNVDIIDNEAVETIDRVSEGQVGDKWKSTIKENDLSFDFAIDKPKTGNANAAVEGDTTPDESAGDSTDSKEVIEQEPSDAVGEDAPKEVLAIIEVMKEKNYIIESAAYKMNIVGVRNQYPGQNYSNKFIDRMYLIFKDGKSDKWKYKTFPVSTLAGLNTKVKSKHVKQGAPSSWVGTRPTMKKLFAHIRKKGKGILAEGQYQNVYKMSTFMGDRAMKTFGAQQIAYRDQNWNSKKITYSYRDKGSNACMYIHKAYNGSSVSKYVNNWSEGCQVFPSKKVLNGFFDLCEKHKSKHGNKFHYTLMTSKDVNDMKAKLES